MRQKEAIVASLACSGVFLKALYHIKSILIRYFIQNILFSTTFVSITCDRQTHFRLCRLCWVAQAHPSNTHSQT